MPDYDPILIMILFIHSRCYDYDTFNKKKKNIKLEISTNIKKIFNVKLRICLSFTILHIYSIPYILYI